VSPVRARRPKIRDGKAHQLPSTIETSGGDGMITLDRCVLDLLERGVVTREEASPYLRTPFAPGDTERRPHS
jgi:twitching motility protein PilT